MVKIYTISNPEKSGYSHWSDNLEMVIIKDGVEIRLIGKELEELIKSLPRTVGGKY